MSDFDDKPFVPKVYKSHINWLQPILHLWFAMTLGREYQTGHMKSKE